MGKIRSLSVLRHIQTIWPLFKLIPAEVGVAHRFRLYPKNSGFPISKNLGNKKNPEKSPGFGNRKFGSRKTHYGLNEEKRY